MGEIVNLHRRRKNNARAEAEKKSGENRIRFGETKAVRAQRRAEGERQEQALAGHRMAAGEDSQ